MKATPAAVAALQEATSKWPKRNRASDGLLPSAAHVAKATAEGRVSDHDDGFAWDLTHDPDNGVDCAALFVSLRKDPRVEYLIFAGKIWSRDKGERVYTGSNKHHKHLHCSIRRDGKAHLNTTSWFAAKPVAVTSLLKPKPVPKPAPVLRTHKVVAGDTLLRLARRYGVTAAAIRKANNLQSDLIRLGQVLKIPH
jgi:LysM repeat protein